MAVTFFMIATKQPRVSVVLWTVASLLATLGVVAVTGNISVQLIGIILLLMAFVSSLCTLFNRRIKERLCEN